MEFKEVHRAFQSNFEVDLCRFEGQSERDDGKCKVSFGIIADVQYADSENSFIVYGNYKRHRFFSNGLEHIRKAVDFWRQNHSNRNFKFLIQLGDLLDRKSRPNQDSLLEKTLVELNKISTVTNENRTRPELLHIWGNHEMDIYKRSELKDSILNSANALREQKRPRESAPSTSNYYVYDVSEELRLICLDCFEVSVLGHDLDDPSFQEAQNLLNMHNKNEMKNSPEGLDGDLKRFVNWNGGLSSKQLEWFESQLGECKRLRKKAIVCGHIGVVDLEYDTFMLWNYKEVLGILKNFKGTVIAYLSGHNHSGEYYLDRETGIYHITIPGIIETDLFKKALATVEIFSNRIVFKYTSD